MKKKVLFFIFLICNAITSTAQNVKIDTIYYDQEWKVVNHPAFASYFRILASSNEDGASKKYRSFYINGTLQADGNYISLDKEDDAKSVFDGKCVGYHENGKNSFVYNYQNGKQEGLQTEYYETGSVKKECEYRYGVPHGLYNEYDENGIQIKKALFRNGKLNGDYYEFSPETGVTIYANMLNDTYNKYTYFSPDGYNMDFDRETNSPIYKTPSSAERKLYVDNGNEMPYYVCNGILVGMKYSNVNDYGKYAMIEITIINNLDTDFEFDPTKIRGTEEDTENLLFALSASEYDKKVRNRQGWASALNAIGNAIDASNAGRSSSTTTVSGRVDNATGYAGAAVGAYGNNTGYRSAGAAVGVGASASSTRYKGASTTTSYDGTSAYWINEHNKQQQADYDAQLAADRAARQQGYLKTQTISRGSSISGFVMLPLTKKNIVITIPVHGIDYKFRWLNNWGPVPKSADWK